MEYENRNREIMASARLIQKMANSGFIRIDTVIIEPDKIILAKGTRGEDNYMELNEIYIDDKQVEAFNEECLYLKDAILREARNKIKDSGIEFDGIDDSIKN